MGNHFPSTENNVLAQAGQFPAVPEKSGAWWKHFILDLLHYLTVRARVEVIFRVIAIY